MLSLRTLLCLPHPSGQRTCRCTPQVGSSSACVITRAQWWAHTQAGMVYHTDGHTHRQACCTTLMGTHTGWHAALHWWAHTQTGMLHHTDGHTQAGMLHYIGGHTQAGMLHHTGGHTQAGMLHHTDGHTHRHACCITLMGTRRQACCTTLMGTHTDRHAAPH